MRYSKVRKDYGYRGGVAAEVLQKCSSRLGDRCKRKNYFCKSFSSLANCAFQSSAKASSYLLNKVEPFITEKGESNSITISVLNKDKLIHYIADLKRLVSAYEGIKSIKGNLTKAVSNQPLNGITLKWFKTTSKLISAGKYNFKLSRRVMIPKAGSDKGERPLTITPPRDKIVQKSISEALYDLYEPLFLNYSHGYRRNRDCHSALELVDRTFRGITWVILGGIKGCFDNINHTKLLGLLKKQVKCDKTVMLIKKSLKTGSVVDHKGFSNFEVGVPQGSMMGPILSNIYLHEFDVFVDSLITELTCGKERKKNPEYRKTQYNLQVALKNKNVKEVIRLRRIMWKISSKDVMGSNFIRVSYVRYADDFLIGITGPFSLAKSVLNRITFFLKNELQLELNPKKSNIVHFNKSINFLGTIISSGYSEIKLLKLVGTGKEKGTKVRISPRISFHAPIRSLFEKLVIKKFFKWKCQRKLAARPTARRNLINLDHCTIILYYNTVINGLMNYYHFADNRKSMGSIVHGLKLSCAFTLALKYKLRTLAKTFKKFKSLLKDPNSNIQLNIPSTFSRVTHKLKFNSKGIRTPDQNINLSYSNKFTISNLLKECIICNSIVSVQMHHVRVIKELRSR